MSTRKKSRLLYLRLALFSFSLLCAVVLLMLRLHSINLPSPNRATISLQVIAICLLFVGSTIQLFVLLAQPKNRTEIH